MKMIFGKNSFKELEKKIRRMLGRIVWFGRFCLTAPQPVFMPKSKFKFKFYNQFNRMTLIHD